MPMVLGIRKKVRNSGVLVDWTVQVVQEGDEFDFQLGDNPHIHHRPAPRGGRARRVIAAYSIATYPDGTVSREVMNADQLEDIRRKSKAKKGPWSDPVYYPEMCRKTVAKLHSKQLPMSTDLDRIMHRDDELYDFKAAREDVKRPGSAAAALAWFGEDADTKAPASSVDAVPTNAAPSAAIQDEAGAPTPKTEDEYRTYAGDIIEHAHDADALERWFHSEQQRRLRNACGVVRDTFKLTEKWVTDKCLKLRQPHE